MAGIRHQNGRVEKVGIREKTWRGHYYVYDEAGKRHHKTTNLGPAKDKKKHEAEDALRVIISQETNQPMRISGQDTIEWFWTNVYVPSKGGSWGPLHRANVLSLMNTHVLPRVGGCKLNAPTLDLRLRFQLMFTSLKGYSLDLNHRLKVYLNAMFELALENDLVAKNPMKKVECSSDKKRIKRYLTQEQIDGFLDQLKPRDKLICITAITLGPRAAELFALKWEKLDLVNRRVLIDQTCAKGKWGDVKTAGSEAWVPVPAPLVEELKRWKEIQSPANELIFPTKGHKHGPINYSNYLINVIHPAAVRAGIMPPRPKGLPKGTVWVKKENAVNFQVFRRSCATWVEREHNPKAAQSILRHTNPQTTAKHYVAAVDGNAAEGQNAIYNKFFAGKSIFPAVSSSSPLTM